MMFILTQVYFHIDTDIHIEWGIQSLLIAADPHIDTFLIHTFWSYLYTLKVVLLFSIHTCSYSLFRTQFLYLFAV